MASTSESTSVSPSTIPHQSILSYLGLPADYKPSPADDPIEFLRRHYRELPEHLLIRFSAVTSPKQRTTLPAIRNRRLKYLDSSPPDFRFEAARNTWASLWEGQDHRVVVGRLADEEKTWAKNEFLSGQTKHVGKLGNLLGGYEEERQAERSRALRRNAQEAEFVPEEDESDSSDEESSPLPPTELETPDQAKSRFLRVIKEQFIYGQLEDADYDAADWNEQWDVDHDRDAEERWFDDDADDE
ncbi:hypothetical protein HGRIS_009446 [Hohenbuehelia grisea]|uniref:CCD97-like C-terminal domain-containing protein n=1 Tax=Hohenbuehelia grisea TaxID=104357 RepID=A0ABR3J1C2_9AGAR